MFPLFQYIIYLAALISLLRYIALRENGFLLLLVFCLFNSVVETVAFYIEDNAWLYNLSTILEFMILSRLFYLHTISKKIRIFNFVLQLLFLISSVINLIFVQKLWVFNSYTVVLGFSFLVLIACFSEYDLMIKGSSGAVFKNPILWISAGVTLFYTGSFFIMGMYNIIIKKYMPLFDTLKNVLQALNMIMYLFFIVAVLCLPKKKKSFI